MKWFSEAIFLHYQWLFSGLGVYILGGLLSALFFIWYKLPSTFIRPKIRISHKKWLQSTSGSRRTGYLKFRYQGKFILYNETNHPAQNLIFIYPDPWFSDNIPPIKENHLRGLDSIETMYNIEFDVPISEAGSTAERFQKHFPKQISNAEIILSYENANCSKYYTYFKIDQDTETNEYNYFRPKFRKNTTEQSR